MVKADNNVLTPDAQLRAYIEKLDPKNQKLLRSIRTALRKLFPTANELAYDYAHALVIGYAPGDHGIDAIVGIRADANGVRLYFNQGPKLSDPKRLLQGTAKQTRFIALETASDLSNPDVEALIDAAVDQARTKFPSTGKGSLIIKSADAKKPARKRASK